MVGMMGKVKDDEQSSGNGVNEQKEEEGGI